MDFKLILVSNFKSKIDLKLDGTENINDLSKHEQKNILNSNNIFSKFIDSLYFNNNLPNNHKIYNSALNNKHINIIEDNKIIKKKKSYLYDIMFTPCIKMIENIITSNNKSKQYGKYKEIIELYHSIPIHKKLMKVYHDEVNILSYNKKDIILNTWLFFYKSLIYKKIS